MNLKKKILCILMAVLMLVSFTGCATLVLNEEKDNARTVVSIGEDEYIKADYLDFELFNRLTYEIAGYPVAKGEDNERVFIEGTLENYATNLIMKKIVDENNIIAAVSSNEDYVEFDFETSYGEVLADAVTRFETEDAFEEVLARYGLDLVSFKELAAEQMPLMQYASIFNKHAYDYATVTEDVAFTVDGVEIPNYYVYYLATDSIAEQYMTSQTTYNSEDQILQVFDEVKDEIAKMQSVIKYCEGEGIELSAEDIDSGIFKATFIQQLFGAESMKSMYAQYYVSDEQIEKTQDFLGRYYAYAEKLKENHKNSLVYTDQDILAYYNANVKDYDESSVSAKHILTEDVDFAKELADESGLTAKGFEEVFEKYAEDERVNEASDLGKFSRGDMVAEFESAAFGAKIGDVIGNVQSMFGYHLIYVYDKVEPTKTYEDVKDEVRAAYINQESTMLLNAQEQQIATGVEVEGEGYASMPTALQFDAWVEEFNVEMDLGVALAR